MERVQGGFDVGLGSSKETAVRETRSAPPTPSKHAPAVKRLAADICTSPSVKRLKLEQTQLNLMEEQLRYYTRQNSEEEAQYRHLFFNNVLDRLQTLEGQMRYFTTPSPERNEAFEQGPSSGD